MKKILLTAMFMISMLTLTQSQELKRNKGDDPQSFIDYVNSGLQFQSENPVLPAKPLTPTRSMYYYTDRAVFDAEHPGLPVEGFENSTIGYAQIDVIPDPLNAFSNNAYFNPGDILPGISFWVSANDFGDEFSILGEQYAGNNSKTIVANYLADNFRIVFDPPVKAVGMDIQEFFGNGLCQVDIYDPDYNLLASVQSPANPEGVFWGVASDDPIGEINIISLGYYSEGADNIAFGEVSSPSVPLSNWALYLGIFLMVMFTAIRFRKMV
ncbi:MAG: hypothetical protein IH598_16810 [Bacteroidales bacterium]|nr:hypothetical protein [Bacteroidales bacterium]